MFIPWHGYRISFIRIHNNLLQIRPCRKYANTLGGDAFPAGMRRYTDGIQKEVLFARTSPMPFFLLCQSLSRSASSDREKYTGEWKKPMRRPNP
jgi:hypothetical protein